MNKGLIFDIRRFSVHDGPGIRTTVFLKGCPLNCWWCHNPESRSFSQKTTIRHLKSGEEFFDKEETTGTWMTPEELFRELIRDEVFYNESSGGVTFSGGEPLLQLPFLRDALSLLKDCDIHTTVDTCGYSDEANFRQIIPVTDLFLYDLKIMDEEEHIRFSGVSNRIILSNLKMLYKEHKEVIIRFPVIPGINDTKENVDATLKFLLPFQDRFKEINLLPYHSLAKEKYARFGVENKLSALGDMKTEELEPLRIRFENAGFQVKVGG